MTDQPKWTQGPWTPVIRQGMGSAADCTVATIMPEGPYRGDVTRLQSAEHINGIAKDELVANAHLIAAAPDLYAALEAIRDNEVVRAICPSPLWGKMADAMIKARGETK